MTIEEGTYEDEIKAIEADNENTSSTSSTSS